MKKIIKVLIIICAFSNLIFLFLEDKNKIFNIIFKINSILVFTYILYEDYKYFKKKCNK